MSGSDTPSRREALALRAEAERERLASQFDDWSDGFERTTGRMRFLGAVGRHLSVPGIGVGLGLAAFALMRSPAIRTAVLVAPTAWRLGRGAVRVVSSWRRWMR